VPTIPHVLDAYHDGVIVAWVDVTTSNQGRVQSADLTDLPGFTCSWFLIGTSGQRFEGAVSNAPGQPPATQSWNTGNTDIANVSAGIGAEPYLGP
jgi:hypothetical protein